MTTPVRLQLSRRKGFNLQAHSRAVNGLPAVNCSRPGPLGNPFVVGVEGTARECVDLYRFTTGYGPCLTCKVDVEPQVKARKYLMDKANDLAGHNLACWCRLCPDHKATGLPAGEACDACAPCHIAVIFDVIRLHHQNIEAINE